MEALHLFAVPETAREVMDLAVRAGVRRVVVLSSSGVDPSATDDDGAGFGHAHHRPVERAAEESGAQWTHLRPGEFMLNTLDWAPIIREQGVVRGMNGEFPGVPVHEADVAAAAVTTLLYDGHHEHAYVLTGPERITPVEQVRLISAAISRPVRFEELTAEQTRASLRDRGVPNDVVDYMVWSADEMVPAGPATYADLVPVSPAVERLTGRRGLGYSEWILEHAASFL